MPTIFTRIIQGEIPCHKIAETSNCFAFLDIRPLAKGHTLVIPKTEVDYFFDLPPEIIHEIMDLSRKIGSSTCSSSFSSNNSNWRYEFFERENEFIRQRNGRTCNPNQIQNILKTGKFNQEQYSLLLEIKRTNLIPA